MSARSGAARTAARAGAACTAACTAACIAAFALAYRASLGLNTGRVSVSFLASDAAGYITGTAINVDGGKAPVV